ncbi:MAG: hypothetical protein HY645_00245 [Acidobacteria bacterium]|nr:hypothetical protein [Acidobacteriota bacterium]
MANTKKENRLVVANAGWGQTLPQWLLDAVREERLTLGMAGVIKPMQEVGDAEACAYLYTASLTSPMPHNLNQIYFWLGAKLMKQRGMELADFMEEKLEAGLTADEERELAELKRELFRKRGGEISHPLLDVLREFKKGQRRNASAPSQREAA